MTASLTILNKTIRRRVGNKLVVEISPAGVRVKRYRARRWREFSWQQVCSLSDRRERPLTALDEHIAGTQALIEKMNLSPAEAQLEAQK